MVEEEGIGLQQVSLCRCYVHDAVPQRQYQRCFALHLHLHAYRHLNPSKWREPSEDSPPVHRLAVAAPHLATAENKSIRIKSVRISAGLFISGILLQILGMRSY